MRPFLLLLNESCIVLNAELSDKQPTSCKQTNKSYKLGNLSAKASRFIRCLSFIWHIFSMFLEGHSTLHFKWGAHNQPPLLLLGHVTCIWHHYLKKVPGWHPSRVSTQKSTEAPPWSPLSTLHPANVHSMTTSNRKLNNFIIYLLQT